MSWIDVLFVAVILVSLVVGGLRGFLHEVTSLAAWGAALWFAFVYAQPGSVLLVEVLPFDSLRDSEALRLAVAFTLILIGVLIIASLLGRLLSRMLLTGGLSGVDRSLGMLFGVVRGVLIVTVCVVAGEQLQIPSPDAWSQSEITPLFSPLADGLRAVLPNEVDVDMEFGEVEIEGEI